MDLVNGSGPDQTRDARTMWPRQLRPKWLLQNLLPPALLTFFARTWYLCLTDIGPKYIGGTLGRPHLGRLYSAFATVSISTITVLYLRLYFLPSNQSVPPRKPTDHIPHVKTYEYPLGIPKSIVFQNDVPLTRCDRPSCSSRWKPPRTRHCSDCGTCRMGFDHHCAFFANCLTAPYIPIFLLTLLYTPPTVIILLVPIIRPLCERAAEAYNLSRSSPEIISGWYHWTGSWFVAGGPIGRYVGGVVLGWKALDRVDGEEALRMEIGALAAAGLLLAMMTAGLAASSIESILRGDLTVDRERAKSFRRIEAEVHRLARAGKPVPDKMQESLKKLTAQSFFWVPVEFEDGIEFFAQRNGHNGDSLRRGVIVPTLPWEKPYDLGRARNWNLYMGQGYGWTLPWNAWHRISYLKNVILDWPLSPEVEHRLRDEAERIIKSSVQS
ncbi:DHHC palmitoyltransferase-domain-containing protein [Kockovaella imperatae]|uniref:Palmitoyltransferase n=1 Tax=Kockovaella imperatae TaxID=4999 RepID=A0A1Y1URX1_9TREE|nr:DHHC palmitoyltransferase-domain-containing protein [Kockovaella imperatae]ORX40702.1 DHHC palmitoyltransferase-domain-containing protein [Kockovaella imperatae]